VPDEKDQAEIFSTHTYTAKQKVQLTKEAASVDQFISARETNGAHDEKPPPECLLNLKTTNFAILARLVSLIKLSLAK
jgi:hypothetical protein